MTACVLIACGGGGSGGASTTVTSAVVTAPEVPSFTCDMAASLAAAPKVTLTRTVIGTSGAITSTVQDWPVTIGGQAFVLKVAVTRPVNIPVQGVVIVGHGTSAANATASAESLFNPIFDPYMALRGYTVITPARRGNYGSTGSITSSSGQVRTALEVLASWQYEAASLVAVMDKMATDPLYKPYMGTIALIGVSGGAETVMVAASESMVFKAASKKAMVRMLGINTKDAVPEVYNEYATLVTPAANNLWVIGQDDTTTSAGQVVCEQKFYAKPAPTASSALVVSGMGHEGLENLVTVNILPAFSKVLTGFPGF